MGIILEPGTAKGSNDTPIYQELQHILSAQEMRHVIVIDDARKFGNDPSYPSIEDLTAFVRSKRANVQFTVQDDAIRIVL